MYFFVIRTGSRENVQTIQACCLIREDISMFQLFHKVYAGMIRAGTLFNLSILGKPCINAFIAHAFSSSIRRSANAKTEM